MMINKAYLRTILKLPCFKPEAKMSLKTYPVKMGLRLITAASAKKAAWKDLVIKTKMQAVGHLVGLAILAARRKLANLIYPIDL